MATLDVGDKLTDLGGVSHFESELLYGDAAIQAPWIKVRTADEKEGWVFAGAVAPAEAREEWLFQKRLDCYFGHTFTRRLALWKSTLQPPDETTFVSVLREGMSIRDTMVQTLAHRPDPEGKPDYKWLATALPGFVFQQEEGGAPLLFADYTFWLQKTQQTAGAADDAWAQFCCHLFPHDSIESPFPSWKFQYNTTEAASQLGTGVHQKTLEQLDVLLAKNKLFTAEWMATKEALLNDILDKNTVFWQPGDRILAELDAILAHPPACLSTADLNALASRRTMLENAAANGVRINLRSGE